MIVESSRDNFYMIKWLDQFMIGHKGFIAGGCFKNIFCKEKVKDLDIFFEAAGDFEDAVRWFDSQTPGYEGADKREENYRFYYENSNVKAYKHIETGLTIELCSKVHGKAKEVISNFDFTIVKFAYFKKEIADDPLFENEPVSTHTEYWIAMDDKFFEHLLLNRLVVDDKILYPMSTFERTIKYVGYGYKPCKETKIKIAKSLNELLPEQIDVSESLYDGMD